MPFDLWTDGVQTVDRVLRAFNVRYIARDPLHGIVDGTNTVFYSTYSPILSSGSIGVFVGSDTPISSGSYSVDHEPGAFTFTSAPASQPEATYTIASYPERMIRGILVAGFDEMEGRWFRGLRLSESIGTGQIINIADDSPNAYVVNSSGSNPPIGDYFFGDSRAQLNFLTKCVQMAFYQTLMGEHAILSMMFKEQQGLQIDRTRIVPALETTMTRLEKSMRAALEQAQYEWEGPGMYGGSVYGPVTQEYATDRFWQSLSKSENWRSLSYRGVRW